MVPLAPRISSHCGVTSEQSRGSAWRQPVPLQGWVQRTGVRFSCWRECGSRTTFGFVALDLQAAVGYRCTLTATAGRGYAISMGVRRRPWRHGICLRLRVWPRLPCWLSLLDHQFSHWPHYRRLFGSLAKFYGSLFTGIQAAEIARAYAPDLGTRHAGLPAIRHPYSNRAGRQLFKRIRLKSLLRLRRRAFRIMPRWARPTKRKW
jgi:hypothetical protein